jgi:hypothetical protein
MHTDHSTTAAVMHPTLFSGVTTGETLMLKCLKPRACGGPMGLLTSELKTLKIYISANFNI